ncbi:MAG: isoprenylcysteine carboxylmethyltransferase family protein [Burkholderiales bacterium]|nr:isoprenylcysteine carboxylmethyltransferase family protein [Burkholderiales bacterium]
MKDIPGIVLTATIWAYWFGVGVMIHRVRRRARSKREVLVPADRRERYMALLWVPLVAAWMALPYLALTRAHPLLALPELARASATYGALRWLAAACAVACLALTIDCWARMGRNWRMAVTLDRQTDLVTSGLFGHVRHPIYGLSILLMLCSMAIVPTLPMLAVGVVHVALMHLKARNEERHLVRTHGEAYRAYLAATGRFWPRLGARRTDAGER